MDRPGTSGGKVAGAAPDVCRHIGSDGIREHYFREYRAASRTCPLRIPTRKRHVPIGLDNHGTGALCAPLASLRSERTSNNRRYESGSDRRSAFAFEDHSRTVDLYANQITLATIGHVLESGSARSLVSRYLGSCDPVEERERRGDDRERSS